MKSPEEVTFALETKYQHLGRANVLAIVTDALQLASVRGDSVDDEMEIQRQAQRRLHEQAQRLEKHRERQKGFQDEAAAAISQQWKRGGHQNG